MSRNDLYDVIVIGGGPAGLTAGLYLARARYRVLILEKDDFGGQITITNEVVNYPGVGRTTGRALTQTMRQQAQDFGAEFLSAEAIGLDVHGDVKTVHTSRGDLKAFGILIATGASPRKLGFEGESEYAGRGVAYCATCDGEFFAGKEVLVVGGGFAAAEESVFLTTYASKVTVLVREQDFTCDAAVAAAAKNNPKIDVRYQVELQGVTAGQGGLREASILNRATGQTETWKPVDGGTFGVFVFAGYVPATNLVRGVVELDDYGYVVTHGYLETSVPGVYAAGDLRAKNLRQVVTATADGAIAAVELERYAKRMSEKTGLTPQRPVSCAYEQSTTKTDAASLDATAPTPTPAPATKRNADAAANAVSQINELGGDGFESKYATVILPSMNESSGPATSFVGGSNFVTFKDSKNKQSAWKFIQWASKPEVQVEWYKKSSDLPASQKAWDEDVLSGNDKLAAFGDQLKHTMAPPALSTWAQVSSAADRILEQINKGQVSVDEGLKNLQSEADSIGTGN